MKHIGKILVLGAAAVLAAPIAHATSINANFGVSGPATYTYVDSNNASFAFSNPGRFTTNGGSTISPYFSVNNTITFQTAPFSLGPIGTTKSFGTTGVEIATSTHSGETLKFYVTSYTADYIGTAGAVVEGTGYFTETGVTNYTPSSAVFSFEPSVVPGSMTFTANTNTVTPEPSSLMLLGSGLVSAAGMLIRRRRIV